ncbi:hypothetical protein [Bradyrhizobium sp. USDA 4486]
MALKVLKPGLIETSAAASVVVGFAVAAAAWTVRSEIEAVRRMAHDHVRVGFAIDSRGRRRASEMALAGDWRNDLVFAAMPPETTKYRV